MDRAGPRGRSEDISRVQNRGEEGQQQQQQTTTTISHRAGNGGSGDRVSPPPPPPLSNPFSGVRGDRDARRREGTEMKTGPRLRRHDIIIIIMCVRGIFAARDELI